MEPLQEQCHMQQVHTVKSTMHLLQVMPSCLLFFASFLICAIVGNLCVCSRLVDKFCVALNGVLA